MAICRNSVSLRNSSVPWAFWAIFIPFVSKTECYDFSFSYLQLMLQKKPLNAEPDSCLIPAPLAWAIAPNSVLRILPDGALTQDSLLACGPWAGFGCLPEGGCERWGELVKVELSHLESKSYLICESCSEVKASYVIFTKVVFQFPLLHERGAKQPSYANPHTPSLSPVWNFLLSVFCCLSKSVVWYPCWIFGFPV